MLLLFIVLWSGCSKENLEIYTYDRPNRYLGHFTGIYPYGKHPFFTKERNKQKLGFFQKLQVDDNRIIGVDYASDKFKFN